MPTAADAMAAKRENFMTGAQLNDIKYSQV